MNAFANPFIDVEVPGSISLDTSRVGKNLVYSDEVSPGETVRFSYYGGSEDGTRNVLVVKVDSNGLEGLTLERDGEYRRYRDDNISGHLMVVEPFVATTPKDTAGIKRVRFDEAGDALLASLSGEQLADLYSKYVALEDDGAEFDAATGHVVVTLPQPKFSEFATISISDYPLVIKNKNGNSFNLFLYPDKKQVGIYVDGDLNEENITPEQLRDELVKFLA